MDENKLEVLKEINYEIHSICGLCKFGVFLKDNWGTCTDTEYVHLKHTEESRELSIHKFGSCGSKFEFDETKKDVFHKYEEFLKGNK